MDILPLIRDVAFPIFAAGYLLILVTRILDRLEKKLSLVIIYLGILLADAGYNLVDQSFVQCVEMAIKQKAEKEKGGKK